VSLLELLSALGVHRAGACGLSLKCRVGSVGCHGDRCLQSSP
jgi:hypothetical protein